jgi:hypothetical protein
VGLASDIVAADRVLHAFDRAIAHDTALQQECASAFGSLYVLIHFFLRRTQQRVVQGGSSAANGLWLDRRMLTKWQQSKFKCPRTNSAEIGK